MGDSAHDTAVIAVDYIIQDLCDRRGLKRDWAAIDDDIRASIRAAWVLIVENEIRRTPGQVSAVTNGEGPGR